MRAPGIRSLLNGLGLLVALVIAIGVPAGYYVVASNAAAGELAFKVRLSAGRAAGYIFSHETLWQYQVLRLAELIEFPEDTGERVRQRITSLAGKTILQEEGELAAPIRRMKVPLMVGGDTVAWLEAESSLQPLLVRTGGVAAASFLLGLVTWLTVRLLPLRVLDRTLLQLSLQSARFQAALDNMTQGLCLFDAANRLVVHNRRFAEMFGPPPPAAATSGPEASRMLAERGLGQLWPDGKDAGVQELPDGRVIQVSRQAIPEEGWVATYEDVTEHRRSQAQISHMARHDVLTGLPNRVLLREHMDHILARVPRGHPIAVLCLDLDGFKIVNDTLGHAGGDELLRLVAQRLRDSTREADLVVRLGGDEFAVIQVDADQPARAASLADRLVQTLRIPFEVLGQHVEIGTSIGVALADKTACVAADELLRDADTALYRAKADGRGTFRFFEPGMDAEVQRRRVIEADLRRAVMQQEFEVHYQPLIDARTEQLTGFEALVRWQHPVRGMISPAEFIPISEELGLIRVIGAWILAKACADAAQWPAHLKVAVNLSPVQFIKGNLVQEVEQALLASGLAAHRLELEITESVLLKDNDATLGILHRLHKLGARIAMDDFGTGYSSLSYLRRFPFDKIKIDQSFVRNLGQESGSIEIIRAVVGLGKALGMHVLAEGVETAEQLGILQLEGCDEVQGYFFSRPTPVADAQAFIARDRAAQDRRSAGPMLVVDNSAGTKPAA